MDIYEEGCQDKAATVKQIYEKYKIGLGNVAYIDDDINDIATLKRVGFGCCPSDTIQQVKDVACYITNARDGEGVIREVIDLILSQ